MIPRILVTVSDLHIGSTVGLWPPNFTSGEGVSVGQNAFQKILWKLWIQAWKDVHSRTKKDRFALLLAGDMVEGIHHKSKQVMTADVADQTIAVQACLSPALKSKPDIYVIKGTECHVNNDEVRLGAMLGAKRNKNTGHQAFDHLYYDMNGCLVDAAHHMPTTIRSYLEAGTMSAIMGNIRNQRSRAGLKVPKIFIRAHRHVPGYFSDGHGLFVVNGAWQGLTRYGHKVVPGSICNATVTILDWRGKQQGHLPTVDMLSYNIHADETV